MIPGFFRWVDEREAVFRLSPLRILFLTGLLAFFVGAAGHFYFQKSRHFAEDFSFENFERGYFPDWVYCERGTEYLIEGEGCVQCKAPVFFDCGKRPIEGAQEMMVAVRRAFARQDAIESEPYGKLRLKADFVKGRPEGPVKLFYKNGQLAFECTYRQGQRHGLCRSYADNGVLVNEIEYSEGQRTGAFRAYQEEGVLLSDGADGVCRQYREDGKTVYKFVSGEKAEGGSCARSYRETFHERGGIRRQEFRSLERDRSVVSTATVSEHFSGDGDFGLLARQRLVNGKLHSMELFLPDGNVAQDFDTAGVLRRELHYCFGALNGAAHWYDEAGRHRRSGTYRDTLPHGLFQWYGEQGQSQWMAVYSRGELFGQKAFYYWMGWGITLGTVGFAFWKFYPVYCRVRSWAVPRWFAFVFLGLAMLLIFVFCSYLALAAMSLLGL